MNSFIRFLRGQKIRPELRTTFRLALPLMLGELSSMLMGVAGNMMVGRLGEEALAAAGIGGVVFALSMLLVWGSVRMIPTPVAEAHELRDGTRVRVLLTAGLVLGVLLAAVAGSILLLGIQWFHLLGQDPGVAATATGYLRIIVWSMPVLVVYTLLVSFVDAFQYVRLTMVLSFAGLALDVFLNWIFIFGNWGMPALGIHAIAMNTGISHGVMSLVLAIVIWRKRELDYFRQALLQWGDVWQQTAAFIRTGVPSALQMFVEFGAFAIGTIIVGQISKTEQAANQMVINLVSVTYVTIMGISTAGMIRIGQALAYRSRVRIWMAGVSTLVLALLLMSIPTVLFLSIPETVLRLYTDEASLLGVGVTLLVLGGLFQLADAAQAVCISLLRAMNDVNVPTLMSVVAFWVVGIPLGYWLAVPMGWHAKGIWVSYLVALIIQASLFMWRFFMLVKRYRPE